MQYKESEVLSYKRIFKDKDIDRTDECIRPINFSSNYFPKQIGDTKEFRSIEFEIDEDMDYYNYYM